jgi:protease YdgD
VLLATAGPALPADGAPAAEPRAPATPTERLTRAGAGLPVSAVGLVRRMFGAGSGALVGRCTVVTSEHVVSRGGTLETAVGDGVTFYAGTGTVEGAFAEWVRAEIVALGPRRTTGAYGDDWAILRLDRPLGDRYGTIQVGQADAGAVRTRRLWSLGFPSDGARDDDGYRKIGSHRGCSAVFAERNAWLTTCAAVAGQSGGPVLMPDDAGRPVMIAIMTATRRPPPLATREAASGTRVPLSVVTAVPAFAAPLRDALAAPCPNEPEPAR